MKFNKKKIFDKLILNKNNTIEEIESELQKLTEQIDKLYLSINDNMFSLKRQLCSEKLILLHAKKIQFSHEYKKKLKRSYDVHLYLGVLKNFICLFITNITMGLGLINLLFSIIGIYISYQNICNIYDSLLFIFKNDPKVKEIDKHLEILDITLENTKNLIYRESENVMKNYSNMDFTSKKNCDYITAEYFISSLLNRECEYNQLINYPDFTDDVKKLMIKILQSDLDSSEKSLEVLVTLSKERLETLEKENAKILKKLKGTSSR